MHAYHYTQEDTKVKGTTTIVLEKIWNIYKSNGAIFESRVTNLYILFYIYLFGYKSSYGGLTDRL